ncbi:MAG: hypothetical protein AAGG50_07025 [Bacteroidota bacterium]
MRRALASVLLTSSLALLTSCLPGSQRQQTRGVTAADSLSQEIAATVGVDTLALVRRITPPDSPELAYPMTLAFSADGTEVHVLDQEDGHLASFDTRTGDRTRIVSPEAFAFPLMAGQRGDTLAVLNREDTQLHFVLNGQIVRSLQLPEAGYATALVTDSTIVLKSVDREAGTDDEEMGTFIAVLNDDGTEVARYGLGAAWWRHLGYVRPWGDAVLSLSGYRPVADVLTPETPDGATLDTLTFVGFDSPLLNTSLRFLRDEVREPPLLAAAARALGDTLYVLNLRPGTIRVDAYTREATADGGTEARLQRAFEYQAVPAEQDPLALFPTDLDVRRADDGTLTFVVLLKEPQVGVLLLRTPPAVEL